MLGAIIGDIVGSRFEFDNHKSKDFEMFTNECFATDDSIMTLAVAKAIMETEKIKRLSARGFENDEEYYSALGDMAVRYMREIGQRYPGCGYGARFGRWVFSEKPKPYNSYGNGSAMRISAAGFFAKSENEAIELSKAITSVTHNHPEGIKGAEAAAVAVFMAYNSSTKKEIRDRMNSYYTLDFKIDEIRDEYEFNETCQETVPQAIEAFLESVSFEDAIRTAVSVGGDSDTLATITGSIAEAYYGVPESIREKALSYLDADLKTIYEEWAAFTGLGKNPNMFKVLTKYIDKISKAESFGEWDIDDQNDDNHEQRAIRLPTFYYSDLIGSFGEDFYLFSESHPEYDLYNYSSIIKGKGLTRHGSDIESLDAQSILALIMFESRAEHFCNGSLRGPLKDGSIVRWLKRLKDIDDSRS